MTSQVQLADGVNWCATFALLISLWLPSAMSDLYAQGCTPSFSTADMRIYRSAIALYEQRQYKQASQQLRKVASRNPSSAAPQYWLGIIAVADGFNTTAIRRYFSRCIELCPDYPSALAHYYMGIIHYTDAHYDLAEAEFDKYFLFANALPSTSDPSEVASNKAVTAVYEEASNYLYWSRFLAEAELNKVPFEPRRLQAVSSSYDEALPYLSLDGSECFYLRRQPVKKGRTYYARELGDTRWQLFRSTWADTQYTVGTPLPSPFNGGNPEGGVSLTADGSELYYSVITSSGGYANSDLYCVSRRNGRWGTPERLNQQINSPQSWESQPSVSPDGRVLYFASNRKGGHGGIDIWRSHRLKNGDWSRPENLGSAVNTAGNEKAPFLAADGRTLYFLSDGWQGFGGYDIYFTNLADPHGNRPTNVGLPINTEDDAVSFGVTADGLRAYFAGRTASSRSADILVFDLYPAARPEPMQLCRLQIATADTLRDTVVLISKRHSTPLLLSAEGFLPSILISRPHAKLPNRVLLADSLSRLPIQPSSAAHLEPAFVPVVETLAQWLIDHPLVNLVIECPKLSLAQEMRQRLLELGLRPERLTARGGSQYAHPQIRRL